ncbi:hypothetical protein H0H87_000800 [Tephrocybe sp. NHM501043]|nr:hypothetical protein H0H87_000800 [Tephrocybe sp. NHM501043]
MDTVVVVGAGGAGFSVARQLSTILDPSKHKLILISARPHFLHLVGCIRAAVNPEGAFEEQVIMPLDKLLVNGNGTIITAEVTAVLEDGDKGGSVTLSNGDTLRWDALVLAPGSHWEGPVEVPNKKSETIEWFKGWQAKFAKAENILLVGGGAVAIEYAGEIKDLDPAKNVTIVHSEAMLLNKAYPDKFRKDLEQRLRTRGVKLLLGDVVPEDAMSSTTITTREGHNLTPDLIIPCRGPRPKTALLAAAFGEDSLTTAGHAKILGTFQLPNHPRVFACGDIADLAEQRQVGKYGSHATVVAKNVLALFNGLAPSEVYKGSLEMIVVTLGKNDGGAYLGLFWGICFGGWFSAKVKARDLLVPKVRGFLGL